MPHRQRRAPQSVQQDHVPARRALAPHDSPLAPRGLFE
jgi:hypothetical protein